MEFPARLGWTLWAANSPYSPLNLRHLPQPIPSDCPPDAEPGFFTFEDAFEDLLTVSSGRRLPGIEARYQMRKTLRQMFPAGEVPSFYVERLRSQQLLENSNFMSFPRRQMWDPEIWDVVQHEFDRLLGREDRDEGRAWRRCRRRNDADEEGEGRRRSFFDELDRLIHPTGEKKKTPRLETEETARKVSVSDHREEKRREPDTYDEWFSAVQSALSQGATSLSTMVKIARESWADAQKAADSQGTRTSSGRDSPANKLETVESTEEHTDEFGNHHVKRTVRTLNERGEEVRKEVYVQIRSPGTLHRFVSPSEAHHRGEDKTKGEGKGKGEDKKSKSDTPDSGWFWK